MKHDALGIRRPKYGGVTSALSLAFLLLLGGCVSSYAQFDANSALSEGDEASEKTSLPSLSGRGLLGTLKKMTDFNTNDSMKPSSSLISASNDVPSKITSSQRSDLSLAELEAKKAQALEDQRQGIECIDCIDDGDSNMLPSDLVHSIRMQKTKTHVDLSQVEDDNDYSSHDQKSHDKTTDEGTSGSSIVDELTLHEVIQSARSLNDHVEVLHAADNYRSYPVPSPTLRPTPSTKKCVDADIYFDELGLEPGDCISDQYMPLYGLTFTSSGDGALGDHPCLFDTGNPYKKVGELVCGDKDLGAPNRECPGGGSGEGEGGEPGPNGSNPHKNCEPLGNVLIIQEDNRRNPCGDIPDDNQEGGEITMNFAPVAEEVYDITLLDVDYEVSIIVVYIDDDGKMKEKAPIQVPLLGDNSLQTVELSVRNVVQLRLWMERSGAVTSLRFCYTPPPPPPTTQPITPATEAPITPPTKRPTSPPTPRPTRPPTTKAPTPAKPGRVRGIVFEDINGNGIRDTSEPGISGVDVVIIDSSGAIQIITTGGNGRYSASVPAGTTEIDIDEDTLPDGYKQTKGNNPTEVVVPAGGVATDEDGYQILGEVEGVIFEDTNGNGSQDPGELGIEGVVVMIIDSSGESQTETTDDDGEYSVVVPRGPTEIAINEDTLPADVVQTAGENPTSVDVPGGGTATDEDGYQPRPPITEAPITPPTKRPTPSPTPRPTRPPQTKKPTLSPTPRPSTPATGAPFTPPTKRPTFTPTPRPTRPPTTKAPTPAKPGRVRGIVFEDINGNGIRDIGEPGISGVDVVIIDSSGVIQTKTTGGNGRYSASIPAGTTGIDIDEDTLPDGYKQTTGNNPTEVVVPTGGVATDEDGYQILGEVEGVIFEDTNGNGSQDSGEPGIKGVFVVIIDSSGEPLTETTDDDGEYSAVVPRGPTEIAINEDTLPVDVIQTAGDNPTTVEVPGGGTATDEDGFQPRTPITEAPITPPTKGPTPSPTPRPTMPPQSKPPTSECEYSYKDWVRCVERRRGCRRRCDTSILGDSVDDFLTPGQDCDTFLDWADENDWCCRMCEDEFEEFKDCKDCEDVSPAPEPSLIIITPKPTPRPTPRRPTTRPTPRPTRRTPRPTPRPTPGGRPTPPRVPTGSGTGKGKEMSTGGSSSSSGGKGKGMSIGGSPSSGGGSSGGGSSGKGKGMSIGGSPSSGGVSSGGGSSGRGSSDGGSSGGSGHKPGSGGSPSSGNGGGSGSSSGGNVNKPGGEGSPSLGNGSTTGGDGGTHKKVTHKEKVGGASSRRRGLLSGYDDEWMSRPEDSAGAQAQRLGGWM